MHSVCVSFYVVPPLENPPAVSIPEKSNTIHFDNELCEFVQSQGMNSIVDQAFIYTCKLYMINSEVFSILRDLSLTQLPPLASIFSKYVKYLDLMDSLPEKTRHRGKSPLAVLHLQ